MDPDVAEFPTVQIERACSPSDVLVGTGMEEAGVLPGENIPARISRVSLTDQVAVLDKERDKGLHNLVMLRRLQREGSVSVDDLNINLMPVINNQRRANESLDRAVRKVLKFKKRSSDTVGPVPVPAHLIDPNASVDEPDGSRVSSLHQAA